MGLAHDAWTLARSNAISPLNSPSCLSFLYPRLISTNRTLAFTYLLFGPVADVQHMMHSLNLLATVFILLFNTH